MNEFEIVLGIIVVCEFVLVFWTSRLVTKLYLRSATHERLPRILSGLAGVTWIAMVISYILVLIFQMVSFSSLLSMAVQVTVIMSLITFLCGIAVILMSRRKFVRT